MKKDRKKEKERERKKERESKRKKEKERERKRKKEKERKKDRKSQKYLYLNFIKTTCPHFCFNEYKKVISKTCFKSISNQFKMI